MKNTVKFFSLVIIMVLFSCSSEPIIESETSLQSVAVKAAAKKSTVPVVDNNRVEIMGATSTLHRNKNGITVNFKTKGLIPGNAYTLWLVIWDSPPPPPPGPTSSNYAAGHIAGGSGNGNFSAHLSNKPGFDPLKDEVHVVLRTHGQAVPGMIPDQIHTYSEGCINNLPAMGMLWEDSDELGRCADIQVAVHPLID